MKKIAFSMLFLLFAASAFSQSPLHRFEVNSSFGRQQYNGDRGNDFTGFSRCMYGVGSFGINYNLNSSFALKVFTTISSYGYTPLTPEERAQAHDEILSSHMLAGVIALDYKFANGYLLKKEARFAPSVHLGVAVNKITDFMEMDCVTEGTFLSFNTGASLRYNFTQRFHALYEMRFGYFATDVIDEISQGANDMYMQNAIGLGFRL